MCGETELRSDVGGFDFTCEFCPTNLFEDIFHFTCCVGQPTGLSSCKEELFLFELEEQQLKQLPFVPQQAVECGQVHGSRFSPWWWNIFCL